MSAGAAPPLAVLFLDNHLLAIAKPAGMLSQGDHTGDASALELGKAYLKARFDKPGNVFLGLVHRLDRPTSGVLVLARTSKAAARLSEQIRQRTWRKTYLALPCAVPTGLVRGGAAQRWDDWLVPAPEGGTSRIVAAGGAGAQQASLTVRYAADTHLGPLLEIELLTGRKHQIRAQLAHRGAPLRGDGRYGATLPFAPGAIALHAARVVLAHPIGGASLCIEAPLPAAFGD